MCSKLKSGVSVVVIDHKHIHFGGPSLWRLLLTLCENFFDCHNVFSSLKLGVILPLFKGKSAKASRKDNYKGGNIFLLSARYSKWSCSIKHMPYKITFSLIFGLDFKREWASLRHHLSFLNQSIACLKVVAKYLYAFLMYAKHLTLFGLMVFYLSYSVSSV